MPMITLHVDGRRVNVAPGATLLDAADEAGVFVPRLCHLPGFSPRSVCRMCMVRREGQPALVPACSTPAAPGDVIITAADDLVNLRSTLVELSLAEHGPCADEDCDVTRQARMVGVEGTRFSAPRPAEGLTAITGYISADFSLCVHCDRCIRVCSERGALARVGRGAAVSAGFVTTPRGSEGSPCTTCGDCLAVCVGHALQARRGPAGS